MKKAIFSVLVIIVVMFCSFAVHCFQSPKTLPDGTIEIDFMKDRPNWLASRILYNYVLKEVKMSPKEAKDANIVPSAVKAYFVDLNDDGKKEIIGIVNSSFYIGSAGHSLIVMEGNFSALKDITLYLSFAPQDKFYVSTNKTSGYRDIKYTFSHSCISAFVEAKYTNGYYYSKQAYDAFKKSLSDYSCFTSE